MCEAGRSGAPPRFVGRGVSGRGHVRTGLCLGADLLLLPLLGGGELSKTITLIIIGGRNIVGNVLAAQFRAFAVRGQRGRTCRGRGCDACILRGGWAPWFAIKVGGWGVCRRGRRVYWYRKTRWRCRKHRMATVFQTAQRIPRYP